MSQDNINYSSAGYETTAARSTVSIFADSSTVRQETRQDVENSGSAIAQVAELHALMGNGDQPKSDIVICDCPVVTPELCEALSRFDRRSARLGQYVIISTTIAALDAIFACFDESSPQILVAVGRAERMIALGRARVRSSNSRLREMGDEDRLLLLRLTEQVDRMAERLDRVQSSFARSSHDSAFRFESPSSGYRGQSDDGSDRLTRASRPALPDPRMVRRIIRQRQLRGRFFDGELFADPAWDMLLDLTAARAENLRVSVTSLCIASGVPPTTALRWIGQMTEAGLLQRVQDDVDRRRAFVALTDKAAEAMARYFVEIRRMAQQDI